MIRAVHVAAAVLVVGGALAVAWRPMLARRFEWLFWGAALALVITGLGNLASLGGLPGGAWRARFSWKLVAVAALLFLSAARVLLVQLDAPARSLRAAYVGSALLAATTLVLGLVIAHV